MTMIEDIAEPEIYMLPPLFDSWNRAMRGVYLKGRKAYLAGFSIYDCPYRDKRNSAGRLSWSRAYIKAWQDGFHDMERIACQN